MKHFLFFVITTLILSCSANRGPSVLYSDNYNKDKDETSVMIFPYGQVNIPGKWIHTNYNTHSGQYFYRGTDSTEVAVALQPWNQYEFSQDNPEVTQENFVNKFFEWDSNYLKEVTKGKVSLLAEDREKNYLVWNLTSNGRNDYFLFGLKGQVAYNLYVSSNKWDAKRKVAFLEQMFMK